MGTIPLLFLGYFIFLGANVYNKFRSNAKGAAFFKVFLMPMLLALYMLSFTQLSLLVILAVIFSWLGDLFLISRSKITLLLGMVSFAIAHIFYVVALFKLVPCNTRSYLLMAGLALIYFSLSIYVSFRLRTPARGTLKNLADVIFLYSSLLALLCISAITVGVSAFSIGGVLLIVGANIFMLSDSILSYCLFVKKNRYLEAAVMLTYGIAQVLLVFGFGYYLN